MQEVKFLNVIIKVRFCYNFRRGVLFGPFAVYFFFFSLSLKFWAGRWGWRGVSLSNSPLPGHSSVVICV